MIEKNTQHGFDTNDIDVEITEYPFTPGEEFHLSIKPRTSFERVDVHGARDSEQTLVLSQGEFIMWVKADAGFIDMIEQAVKQWRKGWKEHDKQVAQSLEQVLNATGTDAL